MNHSKKKILIVDDDKNYTDLLETWFSNSEYEVMSFNDSAEALRNIEDCKPDLILLDLKMPEVSGHDICGVLRHHDVLSDVPVLYLSAIKKEEHKVKALALGAKEYLSKDIKKEVLLKKINRYLKHAHC